MLISVTKPYRTETMKNIPYSFAHNPYVIQGLSLLMSNRLPTKGTPFGPGGKVCFGLRETYMRQQAIVNSRAQSTILEAIAPVTNLCVTLQMIEKSDSGND